MKMYLFPNYVSIDSAEVYSPCFFKLLRERGVELEAEYWDGTLDTIPAGKPSIVRASSLMRCSTDELARKCASLGHFVFYDDSVVREDGEPDRDDLIEEANRFLDRVTS